MAATLETVTLAIILGTLMAIVYSLRILVLLERRIARMDHHIELMTMAVLRDEKKLLTEERHLEEIIEKKLVAAPAVKSASGKKALAKKAKAPVAKPSKRPVKKVSAKSSSAKDLKAVKGIGPATASKLVSAGVKSPAQLARSSPATIAKKVGVSEASARKYVAAAKKA